MPTKSEITSAEPEQTSTELPTPTELATTVEPAATEPAQRRTGLKIAAIVVGAVVVAGAFFGGGVLVGVNLPGTGQGQFDRPNFGDNNGFPGGGPGPVMPGPGGDGNTQGDTGTDSTQP